MFLCSHSEMKFYHFSTFYCLNLNFVFGAKRTSLGCEKPQPSEPSPGGFEQYYFTYKDQNLGNVERNYIIQIPNGKMKYYSKKI